MQVIVLRILVISLLFPAGLAIAQDNPAPGPLSSHHRQVYGGAQKILLRAAETMPEEKYGFKPVDTVRSFGGIVGHIADAQYTFCSAALGEKNPRPKIEETKRSKADLIASLKEAFAYCSRAYDGMTDVSGSQTVKFMGSDYPKLGVMTVNVVHSIEHYGNLVTYMRMNDLVPPTSDPAFMKEMQKE
ncbi:MAG: DinB family protein [Thermoanaerobaculia bacterium]